MTEPHHLDRRRLIAMGFVAGGVVAVGGLEGARALLSTGGRLPGTAAHPGGAGPEAPVARGAGTPARWSEPATWGGSGPEAGASVSIDRPVLLDVDASVDELVIEPGGELVFDTESSRTLTADGNVVVQGRLQMRPRSPDVHHVLRFVDVDEDRFVGGGMEPVAGDVGLWCIGRGRLDVAGTPKAAWVRTAQGVDAGTRSLVLATEPVGWQVGDHIVVTPSGPNGPEAYDEATVASISGREVELSEPTRHHHPVVEVGPGLRLAPEVLNLSRNVSFEGTDGGRVHIFVQTEVPQEMSYFSERWMGPRQASGEATVPVLGRYGLHFHMAGDATRGSRIVGGVIHDAGSHAFVAHDSHGITFESCISHDTFDEPYWWDGAPDTRTPAPDSHDIAYLGCVASLVRFDGASRGYRTAGFVLGTGSGNRAADCVAVGVRGNRDASGFHWPEGPTSGVWSFERCISHNNARHGIFTWQNTEGDHVVEDFVCAHNGGAGIAHGAYLNSYLYTNGFLYGNALSAIDLHSHSHASGPQRFVRLHCDGRGEYDTGVRLLRHVLEPAGPTELVSCTFEGQRGPAVGVVPSDEPTTGERLDIVHCRSSEPLFRFHDSTPSGSRVRVQDERGATEATVEDGRGTPRPEWNAVVNPIEAFSSEPPGRHAEPFTVLAAAAAPEATRRA